MDTSKTYLQYQIFKTFLGLSIEELFVPFSNNAIFPKSIEANYVEECKQRKPDIKGIGFVLTGSRKDGSWIPKLFKKTDKFTIETDVMNFLEGQTLTKEEENLLIPVIDKPGFLSLKHPGRNWLSHLAISNADESKYFMKQSDGVYISSSQCREWNEQIAEACNPMKDLKEIKDETFSSIIGNFSNFEVFKNSGSFSQTGPAMNLNFGTGPNEWYKIQLNQLRLLQCMQHESVQVLLGCYEQIVEVDKIVKKATWGIFGFEPQICSESGILSDVDGSQSNMHSLKSSGATQMPIDTDAIHKSYECMFHLIKQIHSTVKAIPSSQREFLNKIMKTVTTFKMKNPDESSSSESLLVLFKEATLKFLMIKEAFEEDCLVIMKYHEVKKWLTKKDIDESIFVNMKLETDFVFSVGCQFWPDVASEWLTRNRKTGFPTSIMCDEIKKKGVHIVPKSYKGGDPDLNWRFSFSVAENVILENWTPVQKLVYLILKSMYYEHLHIEEKEELKEEEKKEKKLPSYYLKTAMMWACEKYEPNFWREETIVHCVLAVLHDFMNALESRVLQHYFIPEINLLEETSTEIIKQALQKAKEIQENPGKFPCDMRTNKILTDINRINCVMSVREYFKLSMVENMQSIFQMPSSVKNMFEGIKQKFSTQMPSGTVNSFLNIMPGQAPEVSLPLGMFKEAVNHFTETVVHYTQTAKLPPNNTAWIAKFQPLVNNMDMLINKKTKYSNEKQQQMLGFLSLACLSNLMNFMMDGNLHMVVFAICQRLNNPTVLVRQIESTNEESLTSEVPIKAFNIHKQLLKAVQDWNDNLKTPILCYQRDKKLSELELQMDPDLEKICCNEFKMEVIVNILFEIEKLILEDVFSPTGIAMFAAIAYIQGKYERNLISGLKQLLKLVQYDEPDLD